MASLSFLIFYFYFLILDFTDKFVARLLKERVAGLSRQRGGPARRLAWLTSGVRPPSGRTAKVYTEKPLQGK